VRTPYEESYFNLLVKSNLSLGSPSLYIYHIDPTLNMPSNQLSFSHGLTADARKRLLEHFSGDGPPASERWAQLWDSGDFLPWDRGSPNPALVDSLELREDILGNSCFIKDPVTGEQRRKRALVPGCGRGYDVIFLASLGYDAYGLEVSAKAVELCKEFAEDYKDEYPAKDENVGAGKAKFILGDFFKNDWLGEVDGGGTFEILYDYTFLCALHPSLRPVWSRRYFELIAAHSESALICVEFPTYKEPSTGGPPFGVPSNLYVAHLEHPGVEQPYDGDGNLIMNEVKETGAAGLRRVAHWLAVRTHEVGAGTDWVSIWKTT